jgi:uncharacterized membrane protein YphA (DoxX/SURF4 family)
MSELFDALHQPHLQLLLRLGLGGLLTLAAVTKLADRRAFAAAVADYRVLPSALERPFAALLPLAELSLGMLLLLGLATPVAAALAAPLFLSFAFAIAVNIARGRQVDCHCFGAVHSERIGWPALLRSAALVAASVIVATGASRFGALEAAFAGGGGELPPLSEVIPIVFVAIVLLDVLFLLPETLALRTAFAQYRRTGQHHHHARRAA